MTPSPQITGSDAEHQGSVQPPPKHHHRTTGLRVFDVFLYPFFTNFVVFALSVVATYLTSHGGERGAGGKLLYGRVGKFFQLRGDWLVGQFKRLGMNHGQADMAKMVFFSFADGSLVAPFVKLFEDKREKIARKIDDQLGTTPANLTAYESEPKQSWGTVIGGRFITAGVVVPTAVALDKTGLNDKLFGTPGRKVGEWIAGKPAAARLFGKLDIPGLSKVVFFEFFYTSVCTTGLYFLSRGLARLTGKKWSDADTPSPTHKEKHTVLAYTDIAVKNPAVPNHAIATVDRKELAWIGKVDEGHARQTTPQAAL